MALAGTVHPSQLSLGFCFLAYLSFYGVGQTFLSFQWDILLLEAGCLAFLWAPTATGVNILLRGSDRAHERGLAQSVGDPFILAVRFLLFKLMFQSGVVKIQANCKSWLGLTALQYHYATQCIPTPLSWWAHQAPPSSTLALCRTPRAVR